MEYVNVADSSDSPAAAADSQANMEERRGESGIWGVGGHMDELQASGGEWMALGKRG